MAESLGRPISSGGQFFCESPHAKSDGADYEGYNCENVDSQIGREVG